MKLSLIVFFLLTFVPGAEAAPALAGAWHHEEVEAERTVITEMKFGTDGTFSQTITFAHRSAPSTGPVSSIEGKWKIEGSYVVLVLPSGAPAGVIPRADRIVRFRIEKLTDELLSLAESSDTKLLEFRRQSPKK
jgi:hypothetical protein